MELHALAVTLGDFLHVFLVLAAHHDVGDAGALGRQYLLLDAAHGQHLSPQGYLARHGRVLPHLALGERRGDAGGYGDAGGGAVLGGGTLGHVDVDVPAVEDAVVHAQHVDVCLDVLQGYDRRFLHHVAQVAGERQLAGLSLAERGLYEEYLSAHGGPGQARDHAGVVVALVDVAVEGGLAQEAFQVGGRNHRVHGDVLHLLLVGYLAQGLVDLLLQLTHAALAGVLLYYLLQRCLVEPYLGLVALQSRVLQLAGQEVALGYLHLLLGDVAAHLDDFHAVAQGAGDAAQVVGRGDEEHLGEVIVHVQVVVVESVVLLGVEHFQQGGGRVAVDGVLRHLVYLVEDEDGVAGAGLLHALDDAPGHGAHVSAPVSPYLRLVVHAAERHPDVLALHGLGDALAQAGLSHSRGAVEADDGRLEVAAQLQDGEVLQYALLHLLHAVVVLVQYALGALDVQVVLGVLVPGQGDHGLQVGELHAVLGALGIEHLQLVQLLHEGGVHLLGPLLGLGLLVEFLPLGAAVVVAQLLLDVLQLLLQEVLALLGVQVVAGLLPYLLLQAQQADVPVLELQYLIDAVHQGVRGEQVHLLLGAEGHVGADEVGEHHLVGDVLQGELGLVGYAVVRLDILYGLLPQLRQQGVELGVSLLGYLLLDGLDGRRVVGHPAVDFHQPGGAEGLYDGVHVAIAAGQLHDTQQLGEHALAVHVVKGGIVHVLVFLAEDAQHGILFLLQHPHQVGALLPAHQHGADDGGEHHYVAGA